MKRVSPNLNGMHHIKHLDIDGKIARKWLLKKQDVMCGLNSDYSGYSPVAGRCECRNESLCHVKGEKFLD